MTFEIKGLLYYRLDQVDTTGEGTSRGTPRLADKAANSSSSAGGCTCVPMGWWIHGGASLAFRAGGQPEKRLLRAHHRSLNCLHVPAKQLPSRAPVLPSRSHRNGNKSETQGAPQTAGERAYLPYGALRATNGAI